MTEKDVAEVVAAIASHRAVLAQCGVELPERDLLATDIRAILEPEPVVARHRRLRVVRPERVGRWTQSRWLRIRVVDVSVRRRARPEIAYRRELVAALVHSLQRLVAIRARERVRAEPARNRERLAEALARAEANVASAVAEGDDRAMGAAKAHLEALSRWVPHLRASFDDTLSSELGQRMADAAGALRSVVRSLEKVTATWRKQQRELQKLAPWKNPPVPPALTLATWIDVRCAEVLVDFETFGGEIGGPLASKELGHAGSTTQRDWQQLRKELMKTIKAAGANNALLDRLFPLVNSTEPAEPPDLTVRRRRAKRVDKRLRPRK